MDAQRLKSRRLMCRAACFTALSLHSLARAAEIGCLFPAGGAPGTSFDVSVRGQGIQGASSALISGSGVEAAIANTNPAALISPEQGPKAPHLRDEVLLRVTIAPDAQPGPRDFRLVCSNRFTAPLTFAVGRYREVTERATNDPATREQTLADLPVTVNGRLLEHGTDSYRFLAARGQTIVAQVEGRSLNPYLTGATPAWFQPLLALSDSRGQAVAQADGLRSDPDPILVFTAPEAGEYVLHLRDAADRRRDDFVYRLTLGELPLVNGFFPMGGRKGSPLNITLEGVNLPPQRVRIFSGSKTSEACLQALVADKLYAPALRFDLDTLPEANELEPTAAPPVVQHVSLPQIINGTLVRPGETDRYRFEGKAGQTVAIETRARQLGISLDTRITLADSRGQILAASDAPTNVFTGLLTAPSDAAMLTRLIADDTYEVRLSDRHSKGGPGYHYRLRISEPRPGFELWVTPSTLSIPLGGTARANVYVRRIDGFEGPIALQLDNPPLGISCTSGHVASNATESVITIACTSSTKRLPPAPFELTLSGHATNGTDVLREQATPAHRRHQASYYNDLVPDCVWMARVDTEPHEPALPIRLPAQTTHVQAKAMEPFDVTVATGKLKATAKYTSVRVVEPANGMDVQRVRDGNQLGDLVVTLSCTRAIAEEPKTGDLVLEVSRKSSKKYRSTKTSPASMMTVATPYRVE